jgi:hypothetical protein
MVQRKPQNESLGSSFSSRLKSSLPLILIGGALTSTLWIGRISKETRDRVSHVVETPPREYSDIHSKIVPQMTGIDSSNSTRTTPDPAQTPAHSTEMVHEPTLTEWLDESDLRSFVESLDNVERKLNALERLVKMNNLEKTKEILETFPTLRSPVGKARPRQEHLKRCQDHLSKLESILISIRSDLSPLEKQKIWESISFYLLSMNLLSLLEESDHRIQSLRALLR